MKLRSFWLLQTFRFFLQSVGLLIKKLSNNTASAAILSRGIICSLEFEIGATVYVCRRKDFDVTGVYGRIQRALNVPTIHPSLKDELAADRPPQA